MVNDAVASLTALAATHHRNVHLARRRRCSVASEPRRPPQALKMTVIDRISPSLPALQKQLDGYRTKDAQRQYTLHLAKTRRSTR